MKEEKNNLGGLIMVKKEFEGQSLAEYEDGEGNPMVAVTCEECDRIVGFINESDSHDWNTSIWCDDCGGIHLKEV